MYERIMVPLGGSELAEWAVPWALSLARANDAEVEFVFVWTPLPTFPDELVEGTGEGWAEAYLGGLLERLGELDVNTSVTILRGSPSKRLHSHIRDSRPDLVVMTTHGRGPLTRVWLGSVADHLIRNTTAPLLLIRPSDDALDLEARPAVGRILVPLDGSREAETALDEALALGRLWNASYTLLRAVWIPLNLSPAWVPSELVTWDAALKTMKTQAAEELTDVRNRLEADGEKVEARLVEGVHPAEAILEIAREGDADLIAMATHGRGKISRAFLGSVADKVIRGSRLPVLLKRPWKES